MIDDTRPPRRTRHAGILSIQESDLERLARVGPGQRITGITTDPMTLSVLLRVEGDDLPEVAEGAYPPHVETLRYQAPPLVEHVDVYGMAPAEQHAAVQRVLLELIEHAGHLGAATGVVPDLSVNAHAGWIGALDIVRRHPPVTHHPSSATWCARCLHPALGKTYDPVAWPCPDYRAAAQGAMTGLEIPSDD